MIEVHEKLTNPPIVEAVIDIDCDMATNRDVPDLETRARETLRERYPRFQRQHIQQFKLEVQGETFPEASSRHTGHALHFFTEDKKQVVQIRSGGFSFNRLAPYTSLDDYIPEMEWAWQSYVAMAGPIQVRSIRLRYINRIEIPMEGDQISLADYFNTGTQLLPAAGLKFTGFLNQYVAEETETGNGLKVIMTSQDLVPEALPVVLDIMVANEGHIEPDDWAAIWSRIESLRALKNRIFWSTMTERCLKLFQ